MLPQNDPILIGYVKILIKVFFQKEFFGKILLKMFFSKTSLNTVEPMYNNHPWYPKIVVVVDSWSLFRGHLCNKTFR